MTFPPAPTPARAAECWSCAMHRRHTVATTRTNFMTSVQSGPAREAIVEALRLVNDPELHRDVISLNMIRDIEIVDGHVSLRLVLTTPACPVRGDFQAMVENAVKAVPGVAGVRVTMDAEVRGQAPSQRGKAIEGV